MRLFRSIALFAGIALLAACGESTGPAKSSPRDTATVLIAEQTKVLDPATGRVGSVTGDRVAFSGSSADAANLKVGDIMAAGVSPATPDGLLRKVVAKEVRSDSTIITTAPARLTDAVERGEASIDTPLEIDNPAGQSESGIVLSRGTRTVAGVTEGGFTATLVDYDIKGVAKVSGTFAVNPALKLDTKFSNFTLESFTFRITSTTKSTLSVKSVATGKLEGVYPIKSIRMRPITLLIGAPPFALPVVVVPTVVINVGGSGSISAGIETSVSGDYTASAGATYKAGAWTPIGESAPTFTFKSPRPKLDAVAMLTLGPRFSLALYTSDVFDAFADLTGYLKAEVTMLQDPLWKISSGINGSVGLTSSLFDTKFVNLNSVPVITKEWLLGSGYKVTITPEKNDTARIKVPQSFKAVMSKAPTQARYTWDFKDGTSPVVTTNEPNVTHVFPTEGKYEVAVTVVDVEKDYEVAYDTSVVKVAGAPVSSVTVSPAPAQVQKGSTVQLTAVLKDATGVVLTGRDVNWTSATPGIASVDPISGLVTGVSAGSVTITASSETKTGTSLVTVTVPDSLAYYKNLVLGSITTNWYYGADGAFAQRDNSVLYADGTANVMSTQYASGTVSNYDLTGPNSIKFSWSVDKRSDGYYLTYHSYHSGKLTPGSVSFRTDGIAGGYYYSITSK